MPRQLELNLGLPPEKPGPARSREQQWLDWAAAEWADYRHRKMTVRWARDLALIKPLLALHGDEELKARWRAHIRTTDEYIARKGWNVPSFSESIDRYVGERDLAAAAHALNLRKRDEERYDPVTGVRRW